MVLPGRRIRSPKRKKGSKKQTRLGKELQALKDRESKASSSFVNNTSNQHNLDNPMIDFDGPYQHGEAAGWSDEEDEQDKEPHYVSFQERTQREQAHWKTALPLMFPVFMKNSKNTSQWGDEKLWANDWKKPCNCSKRERLVDVVDILSQIQHRTSIFD
ncbi:uncharacterized protein MELLADRAFT_68864 [Melampsora larici-populina 98AG31]|uniref:Uncharacterized protein n=1 Tax=Melampsora larici-populina (strain 98AG31 / pathotype 3-4-7) TaxID=747676 RepID=F4S8J3_MELLP|nr:uncharacterized protein MELLADRAFT_68864 [Melampsora larici-populina 98AG31]EGF98998.1 hypothetical protein MELLADRAFT_68864 [Melampsora larici-populina 98AG31]